jgi:hypothetical protein
MPWLLTLLGRGVDGRPQLLSDAVLGVLRAPAMPLPDGSLLAVGRSVGYGLGVLIEEYRGHRVVQHGGNIDGFSSQVTLIPEAGAAIAVLTNRDGTALRDALPCVIYDRLLGLEPRPHGEEMLAKEQALHRGRSENRQRTASVSIGLPAVRPLADYAGTYRHPGYGDLDITVTPDGLAGRYRILSGPLVHRHLEVFNLIVDLGGVETPLPVQFFHNIDGDVNVAALPFEPTVAPIPFERVPETAHLTDDVLDRLAGRYRLGPLAVTVSRRGAQGLVAVFVEGGPRELTPVQGLVFAMDQARLEFTEDGRVITPLGEFTRER